MMTAAELSLWLATDPVENARALGELVEAGDITIISADDGLTIVRSHTNPVTRLEVGTAPILPTASA
jgi:hypothetical protein